MHRLACWLYDPFDRATDFRTIVALYDDGVIQIDTRSFIEWWIFMYGSFEGGAIDLLKRLTHPTSVVLDVGANIGTFSLPLARSASEVHGFEPHPRLRARLAENLALNNLRNAVINEVALSDEAGETVLFAAAHANQGQASLFPRDHLVESIVCRTETLDRYVESAGLNRVDLIKIDVEGAEYKVLLGSSATLRKFKPTLYLEVNPGYLAQFGATPQAIAEYLEDLGYNLWVNNRVERHQVGVSPALSRVGNNWPTEQRDHYWLAVHRDVSR